MKKIYIYLVLPVLLALGVAACSEDTPAVPVQDPQGAVTLVVKHTLQNFSIPMFEGENISGTIQWGDGSQDDYSDGLSHDFSGQKEYTTSMVVKGVETVTLNDLTGITEIDFTGF